MIFTIDNGDNVKVRITGDVLKTAEFFSKAVPVKMIHVMALGSIRMSLLNGEVINKAEDIRQQKDVDLLQFPVEWEYPICKHWTTLNPAPLYRPMSLLERFQLAKAEDLLDTDDHTTEDEVRTFDVNIYTEFLDGIGVRKYVEI